MDFNQPCWQNFLALHSISLPTVAFPSTVIRKPFSMDVIAVIIVSSRCNGVYVKKGSVLIMLNLFCCHAASACRGTSYTASNGPNVQLTFAVSSHKELLRMTSTLSLKWSRKYVSVCQIMEVRQVDYSDIDVLTYVHSQGFMGGWDFPPRSIWGGKCFIKILIP